MQFWHISNLQQWKSKDQENTNSPRPPDLSTPRPTLASITDNSTQVLRRSCVSVCVLKGRKAYRQASVANAASSITV